MAVTDTAVYFIHSPSIPMTLKDTNATFLERNPELPILDPGHEAILEMHANRGQRPLLRGGGAGALRDGSHRRAHQVPADRTLHDNRLVRLYDEFISRTATRTGWPGSLLPTPAVNPQGTQGGRAEAEPRGQDGQSEFVV
ncbi:uncharacterized protein CEXT_352561 [Caerostris extrusa]|uniref:Uncharacterized protein n=1 Tax=Caerostris extrusa TaxID=172846 RepID=A0AAV4NXU1_CAEEX|nr:uncharacterized protein CEXT_352561 [Caerostris extrusa]